MTKDELYQQILHVRSQISEAKSEMKKLEQNWDSFLNFEARCNTHAEAFIQSIQRRKRKLSGIDQIISRMKAAVKYRERMNDLLSGSEYLSAKRSIDEMMDDLNRQKRTLRNQLEDTEYRIASLRRKLEQLQYEYNTFPEEVEEDG